MRYRKFINCIFLHNFEELFNLVFLWLSWIQLAHSVTQIKPAKTVLLLIYWEYDVHMNPFSLRMCNEMQCSFQPHIFRGEIKPMRIFTDRLRCSKSLNEPLRLQGFQHVIILAWTVSIVWKHVYAIQPLFYSSMFTNICLCSGALGAEWPLLNSVRGRGTQQGALSRSSKQSMLLVSGWSLDRPTFMHRIEFEE